MQRKTQPDHVQLVLNFPPRYSIAKDVYMIEPNAVKAMGEKSGYLR